MLQWADNFEGYGDNNPNVMGDGLYATSLAGRVVASPDDIGVAYLIEGAAGESERLRKVLTAPVTTIGVACRVYMAGLPFGPDMSVSPFLFADGSNFCNCGIFVTTTGSIQVRKNTYGISTGELVAETAGPVLVAGAFQHIEAKVTCGTADGAIEIRVDGITVLDVSAVNTRGLGGATYAQIGQWSDFSGAGGGVQWFMKDYVIWDTTGPYNNDFLGSVSVVSLTPDSDEDLTWTPSTGTTGYTILDSDPPNDAQYISAFDPPPAPSVFGLADLPEDTTSVKGLITFYRAIKTDGGDASIQTGLISDGDVDLGVDRPVTTAYTFWYDVSETDPATTAPWTPAAVNSVELQLDRTV